VLFVEGGITHAEAGFPGNGVGQDQSPWRCTRILPASGKLKKHFLCFFQWLVEGIDLSDTWRHHIVMIDDGVCAMNQAFRIFGSAGIRRFFLLAVLLFLAMPCHADGDMSGLAVLIFWAVGIVAIVWLVFCAWLAYLLRRQPPRQRFGIVAFVLVLPLLPFVAEIAGSRLHDAVRPALHETTARHLSLLGIDLPPGTEVDYEEDGAWGRKPVAARPAEPIRIGNVAVLSFRQVADNAIRLELFGDQELDGWRCLSRSPTTVERVGDAWRLVACNIGAKTIGQAEWPDGTLFQQQESGFYLTWLNDPLVCAAGCRALLWHGIPLSSVQGKYDAGRHLLAMNATTDDQEVKLGTFRFERWATLQQDGGDEIEIRGKGQDTRSGQAVDCAILNVKTKATRRCLSGA
jgi:hypothetical protein